ncbi:MAG: hypothetical protein K0M58_05055 [Thiobacillus sp.]|nr:hypothetical protein [Thiobacillus sp.]
MFGLMVLLALGVYLAISALVVWLSARWAKKRGRRGWVWGGVAAFAMYNLVFWDLIPTLAMHKYYCATEAGFWVYKTPEQWVKANPGVMETLKPYPNPQWGSIKMKSGSADKFNDRFGKLDIREKNIGGFLIQRKESSIIDLVTQEALTRRVDFLTGPRAAGAVWKTWLVKDSCYSGEQQARTYSSQRSVFEQLRMMETE